MNADNENDVETTNFFGSELGGINQGTVNVEVKDGGLNAKSIVIDSPEAKKKKSKSKAKVEDKPDAETLSEEEQEDLERCEAIIEKDLATYIKVGLALKEIVNKRLYRKDYRSFEAYLQERWKFSSSHAYRLIKAAKYAEELEKVSPNGDNIPKTEGEARQQLKEQKKAKSGGKQTPTAKKSEKKPQPERKTSPPSNTTTASSAMPEMAEEERRQKVLQQLEEDPLLLGGDPDFTESIREDGLRTEASLREDIRPTREVLEMLRRAMEIGRSADVPPAMMKELNSMEEVLLATLHLEVFYLQFRKD